MADHEALERRAKTIGCDPSMVLPEGKTCSDCVSFARCTAIIGRTGAEQNCDWSPSRFRENYRPDAERWRALVDCTRVRVIGYARGGPQGGDGDIQHIGFEFTTDYPDFPGRGAEKSEGVRTLLEFIDSVLKARRP